MEIETKSERRRSSVISIGINEVTKDRRRSSIVPLILITEDFDISDNNEEIGSILDTIEISDEDEDISQTSDFSLTSYTSLFTYGSGISQPDSVKDKHFVDDLADHVINAFIAKRRKMLLDDDTEEHILSYEESEIRIIKLLQFFGAGFLLVAFTLVIFQSRDLPMTFQLQSNAVKSVVQNSALEHNFAIIDSENVITSFR